MNLQPAVLASAILAAGMTMAPAAHAVTQSRFTNQPGGPSCQLSVPTTASAVRPRASGYRNEGTTSAFVICQTDSSTGFLTDTYAILQSLDSTAKNITCTGTAGFNFLAAGSDIAYSPQTVATNSSAGTYGLYHWDATSFGGAVGSNIPGGGFSVTCNLPPQSEITFLEIAYNEDVGN